MDGTPEADVNTARYATLLDAGARTAVFAALRPALEALAAEAGVDARHVLGAVTRTRPADTLALADLAARASNPQTRIRSARHALEAHGCPARLTSIAPHLRAALPPLT